VLEEKQGDEMNLEIRGIATVSTRPGERPVIVTGPLSKDELTVWGALLQNVGLTGIPSAERIPQEVERHKEDLRTIGIFDDFKLWFGRYERAYFGVRDGKYWLIARWTLKWGLLSWREVLYTVREGAKGDSEALAFFALVDTALVMGCWIFTVCLAIWDRQFPWNFSTISTLVTLLPLFTWRDSRRFVRISSAAGRLQSQFK
jgi:hypothetical protein